MYNVSVSLRCRSITNRDSLMQQNPVKHLRGNDLSLCKLLTPDQATVSYPVVVTWLWWLLLNHLHKPFPSQRDLLRGYSSAAYTAQTDSAAEHNRVCQSRSRTLGALGKSGIQMACSSVTAHGHISPSYCPLALCL